MIRRQLAFAVAALAAVAAPAAAAPAVFEVDPLFSSIRFSVPYELWPVA